MATPPLSLTLSLVRSGSAISCSLLAGASHTHFLSPHAQFRFQTETRPQKLLKTKTKLTQYTRINAYAMTSRQTSSNPTAALGVRARERTATNIQTCIHMHSKSRRTQPTSTSLLLPTCCQHDYEMTHKTHKAIGNVLHEVAALLLRRVVSMRARVCVSVIERVLYVFIHTC